MSWASNIDKGRKANPYKRVNKLRRMKDSILELEPLDELRWDVEDEREVVRLRKEARKEAVE